MINFSPIYSVPQNAIWLLVKTFLPFLGIAILFTALEYFIQKESVRYFLKKNRVEFFTLVFTVFGYIASYFFVNKPGTSFIISIVVTFIATTVIIYSKTKEKDFHFLSLQNVTDKEDWIGEGTFQYDRVQGAYRITNSSSGFIFSKCLNWSDYILEFKFKILHKSIGVILRATNLSNLIMLQFFETEIRAHIRINGFWQGWDPSSTNLNFTKKLDSDKWYKSCIECDKDSIRIRIFNREGHSCFDRVWKIPSGHISYQLPQSAGLIAKSVASSIPFTINLEFGTVGFRNDSEENALVKDVLIEKMQGNKINKSDNV